jgi:hypothetical protein
MSDGDMLTVTCGKCSSPIALKTMRRSQYNKLGPTGQQQMLRGLSCETHGDTFPRQQFWKLEHQRTGLK